MVHFVWFQRFDSTSKMHSGKNSRSSGWKELGERKQFPNPSTSIRARALRARRYKARATWRARDGCTRGRAPATAAAAAAATTSHAHPPRRSRDSGAMSEAPSRVNGRVKPRKKAPGRALSALGPGEAGAAARGVGAPQAPQGPLVLDAIAHADAAAGARGTDVRPRYRLHFVAKDDAGRVTRVDGSAGGIDATCLRIARPCVLTVRSPTRPSRRR